MPFMFLPSKLNGFAGYCPNLITVYNQTTLRKSELIASLIWWAQEIGKSSAMAVSAKAVGKLRESLFGIPTNAKEMEAYDKTTIVQAVSELSVLEQELSFAVNTMVKLNDKNLIVKLDHSKLSLERLRDSIGFSQHFEIKKNTDSRGLAYIDSLLLARCYAASEATKSAFTTGAEVDKAEVTAFLRKLDEEFRNIDQISHIRSLAVEMPLNQLLKILEEQNPQLYEAIKSVALFALTVESEKKPLLKKGDYYKKIGARTLLVAHKLEEKTPYVGLKEFFLDFKKANPDLVDIQFSDVEKSLVLLQKEGWLSGVERTPDGNKIVVFRLDHHSVLQAVDKDVVLQSQGVTAEELALRTGWSVDYSKRVLDNMETTESARRVTGEDGLARWYFPSKFSKPQTQRATMEN
jgi:hypothetical protein